MLPRLYSKNHSWKYNGYGFFNQCVKCQATEEKNGKYYLEMEILPDDRLYKYLQTGLLIRQKTNHRDETQFFEISNIKIDKNGVASITANHVKDYFFNNYYIPTKILNTGETSNDLEGTIEQLVSEIMLGSCLKRKWKDFYDNTHDFYDMLTVSGFDATSKKLSIDQNSPMSFENLFLSDGGILNTFGGEFHFDNFKVELKKNRGKSINRTIRYGSGISDYDQDMTNDDIYDIILGYASVKGTDNNDYLISGSVGVQDDIDLNKCFQKVYLKDYSKKFSKIEKWTVIEDKNGESDIEKRGRITDYIQRYCVDYRRNNLKKLTEPTLHIKVSAQAQLSRLQDVGLCDYIKVSYGKNEIVTTVQSIKVVYDCLNERYIEHELGDKKVTLSDFIKASQRRT